MDMSCFLKEIGLDHDDIPVQIGESPHALQPSNEVKVISISSRKPKEALCQSGRDARTDFL